MRSLNQNHEIIFEDRGTEKYKEPQCSMQEKMLSWNAIQR